METPAPEGESAAWTLSNQVFRFPSVVPDLPPVDTYLPYLRQAHSTGLFSNFGPLARRLEAGLAGGYGQPGEICVTASSATAGLSACLLALGIVGPVLLPAFTFPASLGAVRAAGLSARVMDVSPETWAITGPDLDRVLRAEKIGAVMIVAPFGIRQDFSEQIAVCRRYGIPVVIDNAAGLGVHRDREVSPDVIEVFSMHATKPFCVGEGGAIFAPARLEEALRAALNFSLAAPRNNQMPPWGFNGKLSELHAAVGLAQLGRFPARLEARLTFAARYREIMTGAAGVEIIPDTAHTAWQFFPVLFREAAAREQAIAAASERGLEIRRYYAPSLSRWPEVRLAEACPVSEALADRMAALPVRSDESDLAAILEIVVEAVAMPAKLYEAA